MNLGTVETCEKCGKRKAYEFRIYRNGEQVNLCPDCIFDDRPGIQEPLGVMSREVHRQKFGHFDAGNLYAVGPCCCCGVMTQKLRRYYEPLTRAVHFMLLCSDCESKWRYSGVPIYQPVESDGGGNPHGAERLASDDGNSLFTSDP